MASRSSANTVYAIILVVISTFVFAGRFDKFHPTDIYISGRVKSVVPIHSKYKNGFRAYIQLENGIVLNRRLTRVGQLTIGEQVEYRLHKSRYLNRIKYVNVVY